MQSYESQLDASLHSQPVVSKLRELEVRLGLLPPNGAVVHRRDGCRQTILLRIKNLETKGFADKTFEELKQADREQYQRTIELVRSANGYL